MPEPSNPKDDDKEAVDRRTRHLINRIGFVLGLVLMAVGLTGELLGWFEAVGLVLSFAGMAASVLTQLSDQGDALRRGQQALRANQEGMLENQEAMLENQATMVEQLERIGDLLDERLPPA